MLLRASGAIAGQWVDVRAVTDTAGAGACGVPHAALLLAFADAAAGADDAALAGARAAVLRELGPEELVDAAAVVSNFERMVRVADGTGTPLDPPLALVSEDLRDQLGIDRFAAASATPRPRALSRLAGRLAAPLVMRGLQLWGWARGRP